MVAWTELGLRLGAGGRHGKGPQGNIGDDEYVHCFDYDGFTGACICQNLSNYIEFTYVWIIMCQL